MHTVPDERPPWWRRFLDDFPVDPQFLAIFAGMTLIAAAGYAAGYRDGAGECSR